MKLSEILPDYPIKPGKRIELNMLDLSELLTSCDYEIYRDELARILSEALVHGYTDAEITERVISTMPTWLKRIEK